MKKCISANSDIEEILKNAFWIEVDLENVTIKVKTKTISSLSKKQRKYYFEQIDSAINQSLHELT